MSTNLDIPTAARTGEPLPDADDETRTIPLSDAPPVTIRDAEWTICASVHGHDGQYRFQSNRRWWLYLRQHADGRRIVSGGRNSQWEHEADLRAGYVLGAGQPWAAVLATLHQVASEIGQGDDLVRALVQRLPAVTL